MTALIIILAYLSLLLVLGLVSNRAFRGTAADYFLASRGIGSFFLLMSLFGTTMTAFALIGSTGESFKSGIGVYGKMASWSGIVHSACFFLVGIKLWSFGKRFGYTTQIEFFRDRFDSNSIGLLLFPILVGLIIPYLLIGVIGAGATIEKVTTGAMVSVFPDQAGAVPYWLGSGLICVVVLIYVFLGGARGTAWANALQTIVFIGLGIATFAVVSDKLGGLSAATEMVQKHNPEKLRRTVRADDPLTRYHGNVASYESKIAASEGSPGRKIRKPEPPHGIGQLEFLTYMFIPLSVGMFPHLFQHWLTAKSARSFKLAVVMHPILIMVVWVPCVMMGSWATSAIIDGRPLIPPGFSRENAVLGMMVGKLTGDFLGGLLTAGILAAIMSSLDSQFLCIGTMFTHDIVGHYFGKDRLSDKAKVRCGRVFVVFIVVLTYLLAQTRPGGVFTLGIWCFTGFAGLFPLVFSAVHWRGVTKAGAYACVLTTAMAWLYFFREAGYGANRTYLFHGMVPAAVIVTASAVALIVVSLATRAPASSTVEKFFPAKPGRRS